MKKILLPRLVTGWIMFGAVGIANALPISVFDNIPTTQWMNVNSGSVWGQFDISSALPQDGTFNKPYTITDAIATLTFQDNTVWVRTDYNTQWLSQYSYVDSSGRTIEIHERRATTHYISELERATLYIDGKYSYGTPAWSVLPTVDNGTTDIVSENDTLNKTTIVRTQNHDVYSGYFGTFTIEQTLADLALTNLSTTGKVNFATWVQTGEIALLEGKLTVNVSAHPVLEPATMLLMGTGLAGIGFSRRKAT